MKQIFVIVAVLVAAPVYAQSPYVAGIVGAEVVRTSSSGGRNNGNGEALAGAVRVGTFLTPRIGVEVEMHLPARIESTELGIYPALEGSLQPGTALAYLFDVLPSSVRVPQTRTEVRAVTTSALLFASQKVSSRLDLVYLGGVGFTRVSRRFSFDGPMALAELIPIRLDLENVQYGAGPVVGIEARMAFSAHARVVGGIRLHAPSQALLDGWLIRPGVGVSWSF